MLSLVLVDSHVDRQKQLVKLSSELDFSCRVFVTAAAALNFLSSHEVDIVFVADSLPDDSGYDLCKKIHLLPSFLYCPVIMLASSPHQELIAKAMAAGIIDVYQPDQNDELRIYLQRFARQHQPISGRVLLVEDSASLQRAASAALKQLGLFVLAVSDVESAWYYFQQQKFDLVIVDLVLDGDASGLVLINKIRRLEDSCGDLPIMVMSSYNDESRRIQLYRSGVSEYLHKPVAYEELKVRTRQLLLGWKVQLQLRLQKNALAEKNQSLQKFLGRVSHECRNAINVVMGTAKRLLKRSNSDDQVQNQLRMIVNASEHQLLLVNDILDYSKLEAGTLELHQSSFDVRDMVAESMVLFQLRCDDLGLTLTSNFSDKVPDVVVSDRRRIKQVLMNLLGNALAFIRTGGVVVRVELVDDNICYSVEDTGPGISEAEQVNLFQAFSQTDLARSHQSGTGLGLAICAEFAQLMDGSMSVSSEYGVGSCFTLKIPLHV